MTEVIGPGFPFTFDPQTGSVRMTSGEQKLVDNIRLILGIRLGERPMIRNFGSPLRSLINEPNDGGLGRLITRYARETLMQLEPRIRVLDVQYHSTGGEAHLELKYAPADRADVRLLLVPLS